MSLVNWAEGRADASGQINQDVYPQTGTVNFPDDRSYELYYYPDEAIIYWDGDKGSTSSSWVGVKQLGKRIAFIELL